MKLPKTIVLRERLARWSPTMLVALAALALWELAVWAFEFSPATLPRPGAVLKAAIDHHEQLVKAFCSTGLAALVGLICAISIGSTIGVVFSQSRRIRLAFFPYVVFLQTVPIVAIAPLLIIWSGYQFRTVVMVTVIVSLFPIVNGATAGLTAIDRQWADLFSLYGAGRIQTLFRLRIPAGVPYLMVGAKTASGLAVIGAIVAEFFVGNGTRYDGLGTLMGHWQGFLKTDALVAALFASTLLGLLLFGLVHLIERTLLRRWSGDSAPN